jgi:WD40 repeat protein
VDKTARIWAADGTLRATLTGHKGGVGAVAIAPDGTWLATGDVGTVRIWAADVPTPA